MLLNNTKEQFIEVCKEMFEGKEIKKLPMMQKSKDYTKKIRNRV